MYPTAKVLHYAQEIFEGMKAYRVNGSGPFIFRPEENYLRFNRSAERMAMPHVPHQIFMDAVNEVVSYTANFVPRRSGESLYLRPFMFATEESLGIRPSEKFRFMVIASPLVLIFQIPLKDFQFILKEKTHVPSQGELVLRKLAETTLLALSAAR